MSPRNRALSLSKGRLSTRSTVSGKPARRKFPWVDVVTTLAAIVLAFFVGAMLMIVSDTEVRSTFSYFFARPSDALIASWEKVSSAYGALIAGLDRRLGPDHRDHRPGRPADLRRTGRRPGLPGRAVQHRRPGPGHLGRHPGRVRRLRLAPAAGARTCWWRSSAGVIGGGDLGRHRRLAEGPDRRARGHRDDHDELHRRRTARLLPDHDGLPASGPDRPDLARSSTGTPPCRGWRAASCTSASSSRCSRPVAVWWILDRSTIGFAIRAVGANPHASATAGMSVGRTTVISMVLAGALAGLAGVQAALGPTAVRGAGAAVGGHRRRPSASTRSRWPCSAGPSRSVRCWPGCSSAALHAGRPGHAERRPDPAHPDHRAAGADRAVRRRARPWSPRSFRSSRLARPDRSDRSPRRGVWRERTGAGATAAPDAGPRVARADRHYVEAAEKRRQRISTGVLIAVVAVVAADLDRLDHRRIGPVRAVRRLRRGAAADPDRARGRHGGGLRRALPAGRGGRLPERPDARAG